MELEAWATMTQTLNLSNHWAEELSLKCNDSPRSQKENELFVAAEEERLRKEEEERKIKEQIAKEKKNKEKI